MFHEFDEDDLLIEESRDEQDEEEDEDLVALVKDSQQQQQNSTGTPVITDENTLSVNQSLNQIVLDPANTIDTNRPRRSSGVSVSIDYLNALKQRKKKGSDASEKFNVKRSAMSFGTAQNRKELDESTAINLLQLVSTRLLLQHDIYYDASTEEFSKSSVNQYLEQQLNYKCMELLFKLSVACPEVVFKSLVENAMATSANNNCMEVPYITDLQADKTPFVATLSHFKLIEYMNWDSLLLERLLICINSNMKGFSKYLEVLTPPVRLAIWNFISNYNEKFIDISKNSLSSLLSAARDVFDNLYKQTGKKQRSKTWPTLATLCVLTADDLLKCVKAGTAKKFGGSENMSTFIHKELLKAMEDKDKTLILPPLIDIYRGNSYVPADMESAFSVLSLIVEEKLLSILCPEPGSGKKEKDKHYNPEELNELEMWVHYVATLYRKSPDKCKRSVLIPIMTEGTQDQKHIVSKALLFLIADKSSQYPYNRRIETDYKMLAHHVREVFKETIDQFKLKKEEDSPLLTPSASFRTPKKGFAALLREKVSGKETNSQSGAAPNSKVFDTVNTLLHVFSSDPRFFLTKTENETKVHYNDKNFTMLVDFFITNFDPTIQDQITRLFQKLFMEHHIKNWSDDMYLGFCNISSDVVSRLSQALFSLNEIDQPQGVKSLLHLLRNITYRSKKFYLMNRDAVLQVDNIRSSGKRLQSLEILSSNLLIYLCSTDKEIWQSTTRCLRDICDQVETLGNQSLKHLNYNFYRQLSSVELNGKIYNERKSQIQLFRRIEYQTKSYVSAFNEVYRRWKELLEQFGSEDASGSSNITWRDLFSNYTSLLCALGGVCIQDEADEGKDTAITAFRSFISENSVDNYMEDLMKQVISDDVNVRQMVTISVSTDLSPTLYTKLFTAMKSSIQEQLGQSFNISSKNNLLVDQYLHIVKSIVESPEATSDLSLAQEFDSITDLFANYCTHSEYDNKEILELKKKLCQFIDVLMSKVEYLTFKNIEEQKLRRVLSQHVMEWTTDSVFKDKNNMGNGVHQPRVASETLLLENNTQISSDVKKLYVELDVLCMKAFSSLVNGMIIANDEKGREEYSKYFAFLLRFLEKSKESQMTAASYKAFSRLLQTNVSFGLEYYMAKVYDNNNAIRSTFLSLLSELIKKGLIIEEEEKDKPKVSASPYQEFINRLIFTNRKKALFALFDKCKNPEKDALCEAVICVYQSKADIEKNLLDLLRQSVVREVNATPKNQPETLFRANSTASKLMKKYCHRVSTPYLKDVIGGFIDTMVAHPTKFEIDPLKAQQRGENVQENIENIKEVLQEFIDCLCDSIAQTPYTFRMYCRYLYEEVGKKFTKPADDPDEQFDFKYIAVGGFLILRLICPAITSPNLYGLSGEDISADSRRYAIILTKLVQNLANGVADAKKEEFMKSFVEILRLNISKIQTFFEKIAAPIGENEVCPRCDETVTEEELKEAYAALYRFFFNYSDALREELTQLDAEDLEDEQKLVLEEVELIETAKQSVLKPLYETLEDGIEQFGKPPEEEKSSRRLSLKRAKDENEFSNTLLQELLRKNEKRDTSKIAEMKFFTISEHLNAKGQRVVYFTPYLLDLTRFSIDLFLFYVLKNMETIWKDPFVIVVDCTFWTKKFDIRLSVFLQLSKHIPQGAKKNLQDIYVVNPNNFFNKTTKKLVSSLGYSRWKVLTGESLAAAAENGKTKNPLDLAKPEHLLLSPITQQIFTKSEIVFKDVQLVLSSHVTECEIRLFDQYLFIIVKDEKFIGNKLVCDCVEHIPVTKISDIAIKKSLFGKSGKATKDFTVKYIDDEDAEAVYNFRSQTVEEREQIMQGIRNYVERKSRGTKSAKEVERDFKRLKVQDVPGQLLAISFFNLDSKSPSIRTSAYSLLTSIFEQLKLPKHPIILESDVVCVPRNTETFVLRISEYFARNKPELTLEFMKEALNAFKTIQGSKSKLKFASFILPWLDNLTRFEISHNSSDEADEKTEAIKAWFENFTKLCISYEDIYPTLQAVWRHACKLSLPLTKIAIESVLKQGTTVDMLNADQSVIGDILETILTNAPPQWNSAQFVINKIIEPIMTQELHIDLLHKATVKELVKSKDILGRLPVYMSYLLVLSFHSQINLIDNLPYLLFIISMFLGVGADTYMRSMAYGICSNCVHGLILELPSTEQYEPLRTKLTKLHLKMLSKDIKSSFMGGDYEPQPFASYSDYINKAASGNPTLEQTTMYKYEEIMRYFKEIMECFNISYEIIQQNRKIPPTKIQPTTLYVSGGMTSSKMTEEVSDNSKENNTGLEDDGTENDMTEGDIDDDHTTTLSSISAIPSTSTSDFVKSGSDTVNNVWLKIFTNLCKDTMKTANILLFPKSLIAYSIVSTMEQSYDMIPFVLNFIGKRGVDTLAEDDLMLSVVLSINQFCTNLVVEKDRIETIRKLVLFGFLLLTVGNTKIYSAVTKMLSTVFGILFEAGDIHDGFTSLGDYFQAVFSSEFSKYRNFTKDFEETVGISFGEHFSFAFAILMMKGLSVEDSTIRRASISLLKQVLSISSKLKYEPQKQLGFITALIPFDKQYNSVLYSEQLFTDKMFTKETVFLFQKYLFTIASNVDIDSCASIYKTLARGFEIIPDTFADVFQDHHSMSQVIKVYTSSQDDSIIEHSLNLFKIMSNNAKSKKLQVKEPFAEYGFKGFKDQCTFSGVKDEMKKKCQKKTISFLVDNFNEKEYPSMDSVIISKTGMKKNVVRNNSTHSPVTRQNSSGLINKK